MAQLKWLKDKFGDGETLRIGRFQIKVFRRMLTKDSRDDPAPYSAMMSADFKIYQYFPTAKDAKAAGIERAKSVLREALRHLNKMEK